MREEDGVLGSWLWSGSALDVAGIWGVNQQIKICLPFKQTNLKETKKAKCGTRLLDKPQGNSMFNGNEQSELWKDWRKPLIIHATHY